ncbi:MAG: hypothetical protein JJT82_06450 [Legionellaceae bacterium]|nr:hypothetical protein [Legionellaceae bacterium]
MNAAIKIAVMTASSHLARLLVLLLLLKWIALSTGPAGFGFWGNFITLVSIAGSLAGGGILSGIIKYVAQYHADTKRRQHFISAALCYTLGFSLLVAWLGWVWAQPFSQFIFGDIRHVRWIYLFLILQFVVAFNNFVYGVLNGSKRTVAYALSVISGNGLALMVAYYLLHYGGGNGIFWAIMAPVCCPLLPLLLVVWRLELWKGWGMQSLGVDVRLLGRFSVMLSFSTICFPVVEIVIRNQLISTLSLSSAGYWQAVVRLSAAFLSFCSLFLTVYFVPLMSAESDKAMIFSRSMQCMGLMAASMLMLMLLVTVFGQYMIQSLYSDAFLLIKPWLQLQLLGDLFRVMAWVIGFLIVAKAMTGYYVLCELFQGGLFLLLATMQLYWHPSVYGVIEAYVLTSVMYFVLLFVVFYYWVWYHRPVSEVHI